jgi:hypothetical protein
MALNGLVPADSKVAYYRSSNPSDSRKHVDNKLSMSSLKGL